MLITNSDEFNNFVIKEIEKITKRCIQVKIPKISYLSYEDFKQEALYGVFSALKKMKIDIYFPVYILKTMKMYIRFCANQTLLNLNQLYTTKKRNAETLDNTVLDFDNKYTVSYYYADDMLRMREFINEVSLYVASDVYLSRLWILVRVLDIKKDFKLILKIINEHVPIKIGCDILTKKINELKKICFSLVETRKSFYFPMRISSITYLTITNTNNDINNDINNETLPLKEALEREKKIKQQHLKQYHLEQREKFYSTKKQRQEKIQNYFLKLKEIEGDKKYGY